MQSSYTVSSERSEGQEGRVLVDALDPTGRPPQFGVYQMGAV
jgi:hypothetical protein